MDPDIDLAAVIEQLQGDNELLRETIAQLKLNPAKWWQQFSLEDAADLLQDRYFWIGAIAGVIFAIVYGLIPVITWDRQKK